MTAGHDQGHPAAEDARPGQFPARNRFADMQCRIMRRTKIAYAGDAMRQVVQCIAYGFQQVFFLAGIADIRCRIGAAIPA